MFRDNIALHNANGVIGQSLGGRQRHADQRFFPGAVFHAQRPRRRVALALSGRQPLSDRRSLSQQFQDQAGRDYRLRLTSSLRSAATDARDLGVGFTALIRAMDPEVGSSLGPEADGDPSGRPGDRARGRPPAYIR